MSGRNADSERFRQERRRILRRAALYTYGFLFAAIAVAVIGAAVVAWLLSFTGVPFRETWLVLIVIILVVPLIGQLVEALRKRYGRQAQDDEDRPDDEAQDKGQENG